MGEWVGRKERGNKSIERGRRKGREEGNISGREEGRKGNGALLEKEERREGRRKQGKEMEGCWIGQPKGGGSMMILALRAWLVRLERQAARALPARTYTIAQLLLILILDLR